MILLEVSYAERDPTFCERVAKEMFGTVRKYVARSTEELFPNHLEKREAAKLPSA